MCLRYWTSEFANFFNPSTGIDIDGSWIDMNEPSSVGINFFIISLHL